MSQTDTALFPALESRRLVDIVVEKVIELIAGSRIGPGMKLPPEKEMGERLGVSRTVVREALQTLIAKGLVETRHGVGTIVKAMDSSQLSGHFALLLQMNEMTLDHLHQVRSALEVEIAGIAAGRALPDELAELRRRVDDLEAAAATPESYVNSDAAFHRYLAGMTHNPMLVMLLDSIGGLLNEVRLAVARRPEVARSGVADHRRIMLRVCRGDERGAREEMRKHLDRARRLQELAAAHRRPKRTN